MGPPFILKRKAGPTRRMSLRTWLRDCTAPVYKTTAPTQRTMKKKVPTVVLTLAVLMFGWHLLLCDSMYPKGRRCFDANCSQYAEIELNPFTNYVAVQIPSSAGVLPTVLTELAAEPIAERKFNDAARQYFDIYAWLLPYRVSVTEGNADSAANKPAVVPQEAHNDFNQPPPRTYKSPNVDISAPDRPLDVEADHACAVNFRNVRVPVGSADFNVLLKDGTYEEKDGTTTQDVNLDHVFCFNQGTTEEHALVVLNWTGCGASCNSTGIVQLFAVRAKRPVITQEFTFDSDALGAGTKFDENSLTLTITGRSDDESAHCCPESLDVVTYRWQGSKFERQGYERVAAPQQGAAGDSKYDMPQLPVDPSKYRKIEIRTADCSYDLTDGDVMCRSEAAMRKGNGAQITAILTCHGKWESCKKLASGQTYGFDFIEDRRQKKECAPQSGITDCFTLHTQQYDLIYIVSDVSGVQ
jgi:hypothetical protein